MKKELPLKDTYTLCRCGASKNKPHFMKLQQHCIPDGTETASKTPYIERFKYMKVLELRLTDAPEFCDHSRFCLRSGVN